MELTNVILHRKVIIIKVLMWYVPNNHLQKLNTYSDAEHE